VVMMWVRWTLPRLRIDQVMTTCLKYLLPISCFLFLGQVLWMLLVSPELKGLTRYVLSIGFLLPAVITFISAVTSPPEKNLLPTTWDSAKTV
ncbi:MAG: NADH-quinone oxidoreductase subunit H, partial [Gemmataceae bacterium]|nr:NADH-quinone oxidoreductase subunit H [Gemmataceae bacterium]